MAQNVSIQEYFRYIQYLSGKKYIKYFSDNTRTDLWKSNRISEKNIENITKSDNNFTPTFVYHHILQDMYFDGHCLIKTNISIPKKVTNLYISYKLLNFTQILYQIIAYLDL